MTQKLRWAGVGAIGLGILLVLIALIAGLKSPPGEVACNLMAKESMITGVYKAYGMKECTVPMWLAKTVFRNDTGRRITDLKFRYKVGEYADWCPWHQHVAVDPSQTVVDLYYPILSSACAKLTTRAPAELQMECEYTDAGGEKKQITEARRLTMLGRHEFIFSDLTAEERTGAFQDMMTYSPLLAAWVSRADDVVARLASAANKRAGGVGASQDDQSCIKVMRALYEIMRTIHISYQHPQALRDKNLSYDVKLVQSLQYPRDTIQKRSGTCIDLAILYAAILNSVNVPPFLVVMDGHCFPMGRTPSGSLIPVEATGVGDGRDKSMSFEEANQSGMKTWNKVNANGRFQLVDVRECWMGGIANPELETLPADILEKWGIAKLLDEDEGGGDDNDKRIRNANLAGQWKCTVSAPTGMAVVGALEVVQQGNQVQMVFAASYQIRAADGLVHQLTERNTFAGTVTGQNVTAQCSNSQFTMDGMPVPPQGLPFRLNLIVSSDGRTMQGQVANAMGMVATVAAQR